MTDPNQPVTREELAAAFTKLANGDGDLRQGFLDVAAELRPREKPDEIYVWRHRGDGHFLVGDRTLAVDEDYYQLLLGPLDLDLIDHPGDAELGVRLLNMTLNGWDWSFTGESFERKKGIDRDTLLRAVEDAERKMGKEATR